MIANMAVRDCKVSFCDVQGVQHCTRVLAETVLEAAALGLNVFREQGVLNDDSVYDLRVEVVTATVHKVPGLKLRAWLDSNSPDPKTAALKARLRR